MLAAALVLGGAGSLCPWPRCKVEIPGGADELDKPPDACQYAAGGVKLNRRWGAEIVEGKAQGGVTAFWQCFAGCA